LGAELRGGETIELRSDLGGGKTTFVKGLAAGTGSKDNVASPTFTLSRIYRANGFEIHHFDFYRLNDPGILADQLAESISDPKAVVVVEWADIVEDVLPKDRISIKLEPTVADELERMITIEYPESKRPIIAGIELQWQESRP
jgi:tRNA threonylcarbamoyladenosine biosynthesis protein TsaE